ncbi:MAG: gliding motility-associated ABC transporter ATP-binding subunit GldA [Bacteroidetes bacterium]|nr:MAG: gliding motility-associated ABC transporter ATP-binding subunit GldA [Bacteroidota bacterium]
MSIEVKGLTKIYGEQKAIDSISFNVSKGEIVGFLGPNGAGKSTTMKIITGYLQQNEGEAIVCGMDTKKEPIPIKKRIGYLPEANPLYPDMFVKEYLFFIASLHQLENKNEKIDHVIQLVGLTPERKKKIGQLSKGYKQRVGLAAALIHDPQVLILDEPTSGLDPNQIAEIRDVIKNLGKDKTVLFSSHILQEVEAICDRVIIINKGKLVADSQMSELKQLQAGNLVQIVFKEQVNQNLFEKIPHIKSIRSVDSYRWEMQSDEPAELKKQLLELALQNNLNIVSLQSEGSRLEDIFRALTA